MVLGPLENHIWPIRNMVLSVMDTTILNISIKSIYFEVLFTFLANKYLLSHRGPENGM